MQHYIYGEECAKAEAPNLLPMGLSEGCVLKRDLPMDAAISYDDVTGTGAKRIPFSQVDVGRALEALPEEFRVVATLYFMEDLSYQEIAEAVGVPVGTVRSASSST